MFQGGIYYPLQQFSGWIFCEFPFKAKPLFVCGNKTGKKRSFLDSESVCVSVADTLRPNKRKKKNQKDSKAFCCLRFLGVVVLDL